MENAPLRSDFLYGYATAAPQVEGGGVESERLSGKGKSIWDAHCEKPGAIEDGSHTVLSTDHLGRYKEDIKLMKGLGVNAYRFSISWPRVIPLGGKDDPVNEKGLAFYDNLINECLVNGIIPFVTLYHWDLPDALHQRYGGWLSKADIVPDFLRYAQLCFERYGDRVKHWLTFNEPWSITVMGYGYGIFAPGHKDKLEPFIVGHNLLVCHAHAYRMYDAKFRQKQRGQVGIVVSGDWSIPYTDSLADREAVSDRLDATIGWFADPIYLGGYPQSVVKRLGSEMPVFTEEEQKLLLGSSDFYGCNTYTTNTVQAGGPEEDLFQGNTTIRFTRSDGSPLGDQSAIWWLANTPNGFRPMLNYLYKRYKKPIYVTENGWAGVGEHKAPAEVACDDEPRIRYFQGYLAALKEAVNIDGVDVRSYFAWTFTDNLEWMRGFIPCFGVVRTDLATLDRVPKKSAYFLKEWAQRNIAHKGTKVLPE